MPKQLNEMSVEELKVAAYDLIALIDELTRRLQILRSEIVARQKGVNPNGPDDAGK